MTSREQFELAALAAGIEGTPYYGADDEFYGLVIDATGKEWNPGTDQYDSDMLGVALEMDVSWWAYSVIVSCTWHKWREEVREPHEGTLDDKARALRLARLKIAAEVGKRMKEEEHEPTD